jgi:hypothetical protein
LIADWLMFFFLFLAISTVCWPLCRHLDSLDHPVLKDPPNLSAPFLTWALLVALLDVPIWTTPFSFAVIDSTWLYVDGRYKERNKNAFRWLRSWRMLEDRRTLRSFS